MTGHVRVGGVWKEIAQPYVRVGGAWKEVTEAWTRVGGVWKKWFEPSGAFELISSQTLSTDSASITFSSIPQTFKHLHIRINAQKISNTSLRLRLNNDTGANYQYANIYTTGTSVLDQSSNANDNIYLGITSAVSYNTALFTPSWYDLLDYTSTAKKASVRGFNGFYYSSLAASAFAGGSWTNSAAISSVTIYGTDGLKAGSTVSLYGIKGQ